MTFRYDSAILNPLTDRQTPGYQIRRFANLGLCYRKSKQNAGSLRSYANHNNKHRPRRMKMEPRPAWQSITNLMTLFFLQFYAIFNIAIFCVCALFLQYFLFLYIDFNSSIACSIIYDYSFYSQVRALG